MSDYIVASCKPWHKAAYEKFIKQHKGSWHWVDSPTDLNEVLTKVKPRYIFFLHWNWKVPKEVWQPYECICFHMTDLPYGRGGSPLQNLILAGHKETKLTALRMVEELDAGPIYTKRDLSLQGRAEDIYIEAGLISFEIIEWMIQENPTPVEQQGEPTFFQRRKPVQSQLPDTKDVSALYDFIRMLDAESYPPAFIEYGRIRLNFSNAQLEDNMLKATVTFDFVNEAKDAN